MIVHSSDRDTDEVEPLLYPVLGDRTDALVDAGEEVVGLSQLPCIRQRFGTELLCAAGCESLGLVELAPGVTEDEVREKTEPALR
ncbi:MAG: hypothetical protein ACJ74E_09315 [Actinomycetes bacterium]